jgi:RNA polymerase sigma-70 factor (ECF subfamily)
MGLTSIEAELADGALVARFLAARDESAFRVLYRAHTPYLWAFALRLCAGRRSDAEEVVQECWTRAVERLERFRGEAALRSWLGGILLNCWREGRRELRWLADGEEANAAHPAIAPATGPLRLDVESALAELPDGSRVVLLLHDVEGLTHAEIGRQLGIAEGTSKSRLFAARRRVARRLADPTGGST